MKYRDKFLSNIHSESTRKSYETLFGKMREL